jgi:hypothetical protein
MTDAFLSFHLNILFFYLKENESCCSFTLVYPSPSTQMFGFSPLKKKGGWGNFSFFLEFVRVPAVEPLLLLLLSFKLNSLVFLSYFFFLLYIFFFLLLSLQLRTRRHRRNTIRFIRSQSSKYATADMTMLRKYKENLVKLVHKKKKERDNLFKRDSVGSISTIGHKTELAGRPSYTHIGIHIYVFVLKLFILNKHHFIFLKERQQKPFHSK